MAPTTRSNATAEVNEGLLLLAKDLKSLIDSEIGCDVVFLVGDEAKEVKAHKAILAARSDVFRAMLFGPMKQEEPIKIPNVKPEVFKVILEYTYSNDTGSLSSANILDVLAVADQYNLPGLLAACSAFMKSSLSFKSVFKFLEMFRMKNPLAYKNCLEFVDKNIYEISDRPEFADLSESVLKDILKRTSLKIEEIDLYRAAVRWAVADSQREKISERKAFAKIAPLIRFPLIKSGNLLDEVRPEKLAPHKLYIIALEYHLEGSNVAKVTGRNKWIPKNFFKQRVGSNIESIFGLEPILLDQIAAEESGSSEYTDDDDDYIS